MYIIIIYKQKMIWNNITNSKKKIISIVYRLNYIQKTYTLKFIGIIKKSKREPT